MTTSQPISQLITPPKEKTVVGRGRPPHPKYRLVRANAENIIAARDSLQWSSTRAARHLGFRNSKEYDEAYDLLKQEGAAIVMKDDWSGVEAAIYAKFPHYLYDPEFRRILTDFKDPRAGTLPTSPLLPTAPAPASGSDADRKPMAPERSAPADVPNRPQASDNTPAAEPPAATPEQSSSSSTAPAEQPKPAAPTGGLPFPIVRPSTPAPRAPWGGKNPTEPAFHRRASKS